LFSSSRMVRLTLSSSLSKNDQADNGQQPHHQE
jgi:hypothetical protein